MTLPDLLLAFALSTIYGAVFHLWMGGSSRRLALYLMAAWLGFALGHFVGGALNIAVLRLGQLNVFSATVGSLVALGAARVLVMADGLTNQK